MEAPPPGVPGAPGKDGRTYNYYGLTQSLIFTSILAPLRVLGVPRAETVTKFIYSVLFLPMVFAALGVVLLALLEEVNVPLPRIWPVLCLLLGTPLVTYARSGQEENLLALAYCVMLLGVVRVWRRQSSGFALLGGAAGFALATRLAGLPSLVLMFVAVLPELWSDLKERRHLGGSDGGWFVGARGGGGLRLLELASLRLAAGVRVQVRVRPPWRPDSGFRGMAGRRGGTPREPSAGIPLVCADSPRFHLSVEVGRRRRAFSNA